MDKQDAAVALGAAGLVVAVYGATMPTLADTRAQVDDGGHLSAAQRYAATVSIATVLGIAAVTRSAGVAVVGTVAVLGMAGVFRSATEYAPRP